MKAARVFAVIFGIVGLVLMLGTAVVCFGALDAPVRAEVPEAVQACAEEVVQLLNEGDLNNVRLKLYGSPNLGTDGTLTGEAASVWEIFREGITCELTSAVSVSGSSYAVDAVITVPEIASMTDSITEHAKRLLDDRVAVAEKMAELYDENGEFRQDVIDAVMAEAVALAFAEEPEMLTFETTFGFAYQADQWYVVPDGNLMRALQGGLA